MWPLLIAAPGFAMHLNHVVRTAFVLLVSALLAGCGDSQSSTGGPAMRGVIASASDCASFGPEAVDACGDAIERAVSAHENTTAYRTADACEAVAGAAMCERSASGMYRPRLSAFLVTLGRSPQAEPLYPAAPGTIGFQTSGKTTFAASDTSLAFSRLALSVAEGQSVSKKKKKR